MKNKILKAVTGLASIVFILSACMLDSEHIEIPATACIVSLIWLFIFALVNGERMGE